MLLAAPVSTGAEASAERLVLQRCVARKSYVISSATGVKEAAIVLIKLKPGAIVEEALALVKATPREDPNAAMRARSR
jgi:hypothetical protein